MNGGSVRFIAISFMIALPAASQAEIVSFEPDRGATTEVRVIDDVTVRGTWQEDGFDTDWEYSGNLPDVEEAVALHTGSAYIADTDCCFGVGRYLDFSRPDGRDFSLQSFGLDQTQSSFIGDARFTPFAADGSLDYGNEVYSELDIAYDNIFFTGRRADGSDVSATASSFGESSAVYQAGNNLIASGDGTYTIAGALAAELDGLSRLRVELGADSSFEELIGRSLAISDVDPILASGYERCLDAGQSLYECTIEGEGTYYFYADAGNYWNWGTQVTFDDFVFAVGDGEPTDPVAPSAVPLPAGLPLLAAALGLVGVIGARHRRQG